jgi:Domain of unknown function (DUF6438)/Ankyrin repeats (3 copies)
MIEPGACVWRAGPRRDKIDMRPMPGSPIPVAGAAIIAFAVALSASQAAPQTVPDDFVIRLDRSVCFGECPAYSVTIDAKGNVSYEGKKFVRVVGRQTDRIPVNQVAALAEAVNRIRFFELNDSYRTIRNADGTETSITDLPTTAVSVSRDGRSKQVIDYLGAPESLKQLEKQIDETAGTKRWITLDERTLRQMVRGGWTPSAEERAELFRKAIQDDDAGVMKALLENGADPNGAYYRTNTTPLMMVRSAAAARVLLDAGANPLAKSDNGETAVTRSVYYATDLTEVLLKAGAPADQPDIDGRTPLLQAACGGNAQTVKLLLDRGADPTRRPSGQSALECARQVKSYGARAFPVLDSPPFVADFDRVIALLEQALANRQRK